MSQSHLGLSLVIIKMGVTTIFLSYFFYSQDIMIVFVPE